MCFLVRFRTPGVPRFPRCVCALVYLQRCLRGEFAEVFAGVFAEVFAGVFAEVFALVCLQRCLLVFASFGGVCESEFAEVFALVDAMMRDSSCDA